MTETAPLRNPTVHLEVDFGSLVDVACAQSPLLAERRSRDVSEVSCGKCRRTVAYRKAKEEHDD